MFLHSFPIYFIPFYKPFFPEKCSELLSTVWSAWFTEVHSYQTGEYGIYKTFEFFTSIYVTTFLYFKNLLIMCVFFSILARRLHQRADIVISGGGMVGASAAAAIAKLGRHSPPPLPVEVWCLLRLLLIYLLSFRLFDNSEINSEYF